MVNDAKLKLISKVAQLYYVENYIQRDIAEKLSINRVTTSRLLAKARKLKLVEIKIRTLKETFQDLEFKIEKKYKLKECVIVSSFENKKNTFIEIAKYLSEILNRLTQTGNSIGVSWGYSLRIISENLDLKKKNKIKVIPIIGGLGVIEEGINSNVIAKNFAEEFGGTSYLINAPAVMESIQAKKVIENDQNTRKIIQMSKNLDIAIVGATDLGQESTLYKLSNYKKEDFDYLSKIGVVGVVILSSINKNGEMVPNKIDERTIALSFNELGSVKNVILVAVGVRKKEVIKAALKSGLIKIFMTDEDTARTIFDEN